MKHVHVSALLNQHRENFCISEVADGRHVGRPRVTQSVSSGLQQHGQRAGSIAVMWRPFSLTRILLQSSGNNLRHSKMQHVSSFLSKIRSFASITVSVSLISVTWSIDILVAAILHDASMKWLCIYFYFLLLIIYQVTFVKAMQVYYIHSWTKS